MCACCCPSQEEAQRKRAADAEAARKRAEVRVARCLSLCVLPGLPTQLQQPAPLRKCVWPLCAPQEEETRRKRAAEAEVARKQAEVRVGR
jgi:hypothetical protein